MSNFGKLIREERQRLGMSQRQLANLVPGITRSTISKYENDNNIPLDNLERIAEALKSPRLNLAIFGTVFKSVNLDNIDNHPVVSQMKLIEELHEALEAINEMKLINKNQEVDLSVDEKHKLEDHLEQICDVLECGNLFVATLVEHFDVSVKNLEKRNIKKLESRGYLSAS